MDSRAIGLNAARAPSVGESPSRYTIFKGNGFLEGIVKVTLVACALACAYFSCGILFALPPSREEQKNKEIELLEHELDQFFKNKDETYEPKFRYADYNENKSNYDFDRKKTLLENLKKLHKGLAAISSVAGGSTAEQKHTENIAKARAKILELV
ncbi:MAG: hypothetical protein SP4CHLAM5_05100 [Chlamydiia bacterium]|nr:hypothetical protein [Chlamydiia bacterium]